VKAIERTSLSVVLSLGLLGSGAAAPVRTNSWTLSSPDGHAAIVLSLGAGGELNYEVSRAGNQVLRRSPLGLRRADQAFDLGLSCEVVGGPVTRREQYELFAGIRPRVDHAVNHRTFVFRNANQAPMEFELAAGNEGLAFRYRFPDVSEVRVVREELTGFAVPPSAKGWLQPYHAAGPYTPAYEDFYFPVKPGEAPPKSRGEPLGWAFPALFNTGPGGWVLLTESGTDQAYCACHLRPDSSGGIYRIAFPFADEATKGRTNRFGPEPRHSLPWTTPWRVIVLGKSAGEIATSTLVTDLAPPSRIADTSWIKPGRASWAWWAYPDGPNTAELFDQVTDFAARMGWEYTLFDAGWWKPGLRQIASHAKSKGVAPLAWLFASDFYDAGRRKEKLDEMAAAGVRGVKVDFWCSDRQEAVEAMQGLFEDAAARRMVVNLHGCTAPRGWQRTWPNFLAAEAVLGSECYFFESRFTRKAAELNTVLPFTRNVAGPMDYTPVACSPKKYPRTTTAAHELATALVFTSGLIHYADKPEFFESLPNEVLQVLRDAPARWEETRCLAGEPGSLVVFARRSGASWFIAGLNGTDAPMPISLDLMAYGDYSKRWLIAEGVDAAMQVAVVSVPPSPAWAHQLPPRGGFILRLNR
jgi:hypothetical protein